MSFKEGERLWNCEGYRWLCRLGKSMRGPYIQNAVPPAQRVADGPRRTRSAIAWTSLAFAVLQSVCTFFAAMNGLRVGIGITSLVLASSTAAAIDHFHSGWLRVPMILLAVLGSVINLVVLWQIRRLRKLPAAQWRQTTQKPGKLRSERMQLVLSIVTLILVALEERQHLIWLHHL
jgi:hypothetical protein